MFPNFRAPETMTAGHDGTRDHVFYSMALETGLRRREDERGRTICITKLLSMEGTVLI